MDDRGQRRVHRKAERQRRHDAQRRRRGHKAPPRPVLLFDVSSLEEEEELDPIVTCWCGARGRYSKLHSNDLDATCGGSGVLLCYCGGDFCVCHNHGEVSCPGCPECEPDHDDDYDSGYYDEDE